MATREALAAEAFAYTARYDIAISRWFAEKGEDFPPLHVRAFEKVVDLPYGENPHQRAAFYAQVGARAHVLSQVQQHHGKQVGFNNILDLDAARAVVRDFDAPACAIVKHNNPCGVADRLGRARGLPARVRVRPAERVRRRDRAQPPRRPRDRRRDRRAVRRGALRARLRRRRARGAGREAQPAHPRGPRAPAAAARREGRAPGHRRAARAGPRSGRRRAHGHGGRHRPPADRGGVARPALRLAACAAT